MIIITALILGGTVFIFPRQISAMYTNDIERIEKSSAAFTMWTIGLSFDVFNMMLQAILRGAGKQLIPSVWNVVMSIILMVPVSYLLCFTLKWDVFGLWIGCISYVVITTMFNLVYFILLDLEEASSII